MEQDKQACADEKLLQELRNSNSIEGFSADEKLVCIIRKHPFGLVPLYLGSIVGLLGAGVLVFVLLPGLVPEESLGDVQLLATVFLILAATFVAIGLLIATYVYRKSELIISDKHVTQIIQRSLFNREVSELSMSNVEDVAAEKKGIIATIFDYGRLRIQTAGALENFIFTYCPQPNHFGKVILDARQAYAESLADEARKE